MRRPSLRRHVNHSVQVKHTFDVPVENVWEVFVDHTSWNEWAGQGVIKIEQTGSPTPNGVGCIKVTTSVGGDTTVEEVVGFEPIERLAYIVREGGYWTTDHAHEVFFDKGPNGKGCVVTWRCRFEPMVVGSGWIIENMVDKNYRTVLQLLDGYLSRSVPLDASGSDLVSGWRWIEFRHVPPYSTCVSVHSRTVPTIECLFCHFSPYHTPFESLPFDIVFTFFETLFSAYHTVTCISIVEVYVFSGIGADGKS